jgi:hypothetical protein
MRRIHVGDLERDAGVYVREIKTEGRHVVVDQISSMPAEGVAHGTVAKVV